MRRCLNTILNRLDLTDIIWKLVLKNILICENFKENQKICLSLLNLPKSCIRYELSYQVKYEKNK